MAGHPWTRPGDGSARLDYPVRGAPFRQRCRGRRDRRWQADHGVRSMPRGVAGDRPAARTDDNVRAGASWRGNARAVCSRVLPVVSLLGTDTESARRAGIRRRPSRLWRLRRGSRAIHDGGLRRRAGGRTRCTEDRTGRTSRRLDGRHGGAAFCPAASEPPVQAPAGGHGWGRARSGRRAAPCR